MNIVSFLFIVFFLVLICVDAATALAAFRGDRDDERALDTVEPAKEARECDLCDEDKAKDGGAPPTTVLALLLKVMVCVLPRRLLFALCSHPLPPIDCNRRKSLSTCFRVVNEDLFGVLVRHTPGFVCFRWCG